MQNRINRKTFGEVKEGDTLYFVEYNRCTVTIHKQDVKKVTDDRFTTYRNSIQITYGEGNKSYFWVNKEQNRITQNWIFGKWHITTTLDEAKEICREMTEKKIKEHKKAIEAAKQKIKKWEQFKSQLNNDIYIIK